MTQPRDATERLSRLLGMTGSAHKGEAVNAIRLANALLRKHRTTWPEVLLTPLPTETGLTMPAYQAEAEALLAAQRHSLTPFEANFLVGILAFETLTEKQKSIFSGIRNKLRVAA